MTTPRIATPAGGTEMVSDRSLSSKLFDMGGQARRLIHRVGPVHIPDDVDAHDAFGSFNWLDPNLRFDRGGGLYTIRAAWFDLEITDDSPLKMIVKNRRTAGGSIDFELEEAGTSGLPALNFADITVSGNRVTFEDLIAGIDFIVECRLGKMLTETILKDATAPKRFVWKVLSDDIYSQAIVAQTIFGSDNNNDNASRQGEERNRRRRLAGLTRVSVDGGRESGRRVTRYTDDWVNRETIWRDPITRLPEIRAASETEYPVFIDPEITETVVAAADDGTEQPPNWVNLFSGTRGGIMVGDEVYYPGWRFQSVLLPAGATIDAGTQLTIDRNNVWSSGCNGTIFGDVGSTRQDAWSDSSSPSDMTNSATSASVDGTANGTLVISDSDGIQGIIQDIVDAGFASGEHLRIGTTSTTGTAGVYIDEYDASSNNDEAILVINYTAGGLSIPNQIAMRRKQNTPLIAM